MLKEVTKLRKENKKLEKINKSLQVRCDREYKTRIYFEIQNNKIKSVLFNVMDKLPTLRPYLNQALKGYGVYHDGSIDK